jgi:hypothetical protein
LKASDEEKTLVGNDFIDILKSDSDFITQILWELKSTDVKIMNPQVKKIAVALENGKPIVWDKGLVLSFLSSVPEIKQEIESRGIGLEDVKKLRISIIHEVDGINVYDGISINLVPISVPSTHLVSFYTAYRSCFKGPHYMYKSKFTNLVERIIAEALEDKGITLIVGAGVDPLIPFGETLDRFSNVKFELKKHLVSLLCTISVLLPPSTVTRSLCNLLRSNEKIDMITSNWSLSLERNNPPPERYYNVREVAPVVSNDTLYLTLGVLKDPNELSQHLRSIGPKNVIFVVGSSLSEKDFTLTGLGEHMSKAEYIVIFTLTPGGYKEKLKRLMGKDSEEISYMILVDDLHSIFRYITEVKPGRAPSTIL